eukprot:10082408-Alexandrium_andersonii.AAC.1
MRDLAVSAEQVVAWSRRYAAVEYLEAHHGEELRQLLGGGVAGRRGAVVQAALAERCAVSRQEARVWCLAFGRSLGSSATGWSSEEEASLSEDEPLEAVSQLEERYGPELWGLIGGA